MDEQHHRLRAEVANRRTFAIISHPDAGKTTLTEKLLLYGGALHLAGSVRAKSGGRHTASDWMDIEKQRGISVSSSVLQFDYRDRHMTMIMKLYGNAIRRFEIRKGLPGPDDAAPMYVAIANIWIADLGAFGAAAEQHGQKLIDDVPNFTNSMPRVQADEVYAIAES